MHRTPTGSSRQRSRDHHDPGLGGDGHHRHSRRGGGRRLDVPRWRRLPGDSSPTVGEFVDNITGSSSRTRGLSVDVGERQAATDITVNVDYGYSIPELTQAVRERVIKRVQKLTGLEVTEVNIQVNDVKILPQDSKAASGTIEERRYRAPPRHHSFRITSSGYANSAPASRDKLRRGTAKRGKHRGESDGPALRPEVAG